MPIFQHSMPVFWLEAAGLIFGMLGDRIGRAKSMLYTILFYSLCSGLSALSVCVFDFAFYRFPDRIGGRRRIRGRRGSSCEEVMPARARPQSLYCQALLCVWKHQCRLSSIWDSD